MNFFRDNIINFAHPEWFGIGAGGTLGVLVLLYFGFLRRKKRLEVLLGPVRTAVLISRGFSWFKIFLMVSIAALLFLSLAQPRVGFEEIETQRQGVDVVLAVDVSKSMLSKDVSPDRLSLAKLQIRDLLESVKVDRVALVAFAGSSFIQCPLTYDYEALSLYLDMIDTNLIPNQGTDFESALRKSQEALQNGGTKDSAGQIVMMLTDGEDQYDMFEQVLGDFVGKKMKIFTFGIGTEEGGPIPSERGQFKSDRDGKIVISKLGTKTLSQLAEKTGGQFVRVTSGSFSLGDYYLKHIRPLMSSEEGRSVKEKIWFERYQWVLGLAFLLLIFESFFRESKIPPRPKEGKVAKESLTIMTSLFFLVSGLVWGQAARGDTFEKGRKLYESGDYDAANDAFKRAEQENKNDPRPAFGEGNASFRAGKYEDAAASFERAAQGFRDRGDRALENRSLFNLANTTVAAGDLERAAGTYEEALKLDPNDKKSKENLDWVRKKIEQKKQEQQQNKKDDKKEKSDEDQQDKKDHKSEKSDDKDSKNEPKKDEPNKDEQSKQSEKDSKDQKESEQKQSDPQKVDEAKPAPSPDLKKQDAERLLRSVEDRPSKFLQNQTSPHQNRNPEKDW